MKKEIESLEIVLDLSDKVKSDMNEIKVNRSKTCKNDENSCNLGSLEAEIYANTEKVIGKVKNYKPINMAEYAKKILYETVGRRFDEEVKTYEQSRSNTEGA